MIEFSFVGVDFEDIRTTLSQRGSGGFAITSDHINSVDKATRKALSEISEQVGNIRSIVVVMDGAKESFRMRHVSEAMELIHHHVGEDTFVTFSAHYDESLSDTIRISLLANGNARILRPKRASEQANVCQISRVD